MSYNSYDYGSFSWIGEFIDEGRSVIAGKDLFKDLYEFAAAWVLGKRDQILSRLPSELAVAEFAGYEGKEEVP